MVTGARYAALNSAAPDRQAAADALDRQLRFLSRLGFTSAVGAPTTATRDLPPRSEAGVAP
jgi:hypothetical protein